MTTQFYYVGYKENKLYLKDLNKEEKMYAFYIKDDNPKEIYIINGTNVLAAINHNFNLNATNLEDAKLFTLTSDTEIVEVDLEIQVTKHIGDS